jgi:sensor c-di-GMP phosphodiesterase-like protein
VETETQRTWLLENGYSHGQGYLFGRPMSVQATCDYLSQIR